MDRENALKALDSLIEDLHNAIVIEPVGLKLSMGQCIDLYVKMKHVRALTEAPKVDDLKRDATIWYDKRFGKGITMPTDRQVIWGYIDHLTTHYDLVKKSEG